MRLSYALLIIAVSLVACSPAKEASKTEVKIADRWKESQSRSAMDDTVTYFLALDAEGSDNVRPRFVVACAPGDLRAYVDTRTLLSQDALFSDLGWYTAGRYRIDQGEAQRISWETSKDHQAIFIPKETTHSFNFASDFLNQLLGAQVLHFEFNPLGSGPRTAEFDVRGLAGHLDRLKAQGPC